MHVLADTAEQCCDHCCKAKTSCLPSICIAVDRVRGPMQYCALAFDDGFWTLSFVVVIVWQVVPSVLTNGALDARLGAGGDTLGSSRPQTEPKRTIVPTPVAISGQQPSSAPLGKYCSSARCCMLRVYTVT